MYGVIDSSRFKRVLDPDMQDEIQHAVTRICDAFEAEKHAEFLRGYEQGCEEEAKNLRCDIEHYKFELGLATGTIKRTLVYKEPQYGESNTSKRAKKAAAQYVERNLSTY